MRQFVTRFMNSTLVSKGSLFTWGGNEPSLGHKISKSSKLPQIIKGFDNITQASLGPKHSAFVTDDGKLYTFGEGKDGQLGLNDGGKSHFEPKLVDYFSKKNLKVVQVRCGERHTVVRTADGDVFTFGWGGRKLNWIMSIFVSVVGPLGHGDTKSHHAPTPVEYLRKTPAAQEITAGRFSTTVLNIKNEVYNWGNGEYGVFGDGTNKNHKTPFLNYYFDHLRDNQNLTILKIKSCSTFSIALMSDHKLYGWGSNEHGQVGVQSEIGVQLYETVNFVTEVISEDFKGKKVVDFDISANLLVFILEDGSIWWTGMRVAFKPQRLKLDTKPVAVGAYESCFAVADSEYIYIRNDFFKATQPEDLKTGLRKAKIADYFEGKTNIIQMGGAYENGYVIVN